MCGDCRTHLIESPVGTAPLKIGTTTDTQPRCERPRTKSSGISVGTAAHGDGCFDVVRTPADKSVILSRTPGLSATERLPRTR
jgi:hypothetical protein